MTEAIPHRNGAACDDSAGSSQQAGASSEVHLAAEAVRRAEAELKKARELYENLREQATQRLKAVREKKVGDLVDGTLEMVRKHPAPSIFIVGLIGYFLGRLFRK